MIGLVLSLSLISSDYESAFNEANLEKEPLVIFISAEWCGYCKEVRPRLNNLYTKYVYLDYDEDNKKVEQLVKLTKNRSLPQIIMWKKRNGVWSQKFIVGNQTEKAISEFLEIVPPQIPMENK